jgi:riboflavin-specific deaminase-like protein
MGRLIRGVVAMSLDGKIATRDRDDVAFSSREDRRFLNGLRASAEALVVGAGTVRAGDPPMRVSPRSLLKGPEPIRAVVTRLGLLSPDLRVFGKGPKTVVFAAETISPGARRAIEAFADVRLSHGADVPARDVVAGLAAMGARTIQVEGGGELIWTFLQEDLLDEMRVTVCPVVIGGRQAPTPVGGEGFAMDALKKARLVGSEKKGEELFLHYSFR